ncbi:hypothetical protein [Streptomyces sp. Da 82-17]|uniref:hypothetical protein n=1 Tax=Streptomyces sp. Da 82-17 TaxID=3377116 RepID=UPI0038D49410
MPDTFMFTTGDPAVAVVAQRTATPGLIVHATPVGDGWRLAHRGTGYALGQFDRYTPALAAARSLFGVADWTAGPETLQKETVIWKVIDAIEGAGGQFLSLRGGLGEQVAAKRSRYLAAQGSIA